METLWGLGEGSGAVAYRIGRNGHLGQHSAWEEAWTLSAWHLYPMTSAFGIKWRNTCLVFNCKLRGTVHRQQFPENRCMGELHRLHFVSSISGPQSYPPLPPPCDWAYSQGMRLSQINSLSACTFAFIWHENWKNECLLLTQMVGPETSREGEGGNLFLSPVPTGVGMPLHSSQIRILTLAPLKPPVPLSKCSCKCLWPLPVCKLPKVNFVIALCGVASFIFQSRNSFSVRRISLNIPTSQHQIRGLPPSTQIYYFSLFK